MELSSSALSPDTSSVTPSQPISILTGGILHETNTFNPHLTTIDNFRIRRGPQVLQDQPWASFLLESGVNVVPTTHAYAVPSGLVSRSVYEQLKGEILQGATSSLNGVYLDLHGALHVEGYDDAQLDLVLSLRQIVGEDCLIAASFDLHGNLSEELVGALDLMTAYRTAPHVDQKETKVRAVKLLVRAIREGLRPAIVHLRVPILIPGEKGITAVEPLKSVYGKVESLSSSQEERGSSDDCWLLEASVFVGMAWSDVDRAGMGVQVVVADASFLPQAKKEAEKLAQELWERRRELVYDVEIDSLNGALQTAASAPESTVFVTDSGDNPTAGAAGDIPLVLERLLALEIRDAVVAAIFDPQAVVACETAGVGAQVSLRLGGKLDTIHGSPVSVTGTVRFVTTTERLPNRRPAVVDISGILVILLNVRRSIYTVNCFREVGIDPLKHKVVVVKLGYLTQELRDIAPRAIMAMTEGFTNQRVESLTYECVERPIFPLDEEMSWSAVV